MDFAIFFKTNLLKFFFITLLILIVNTQLSFNDLNYIKKTILNSQKENGLFLNSIESTYQSVYVLKVLNEKIPEIPKICKEAHFESMKEISSSLVKLNELLNCKIQMNFEMKSEDFENLTNFDINTVHEKIFLWKNLENVEWKDVFEKIKTFITVENLFSLFSNTKISSLDATVKGLQIMEILHEKTQDEELKNNIKNKISSVMQAFQGEFQLLSSVKYFKINLH
jgi:hypothetical protein